MEERSLAFIAMNYGTLWLTKLFDPVVQGPMGTSKGYVITQGPLDETIVDFWRMVWEQQIRVIMMLTDFSEAGIVSCTLYYLCG